MKYHLPVTYFTITQLFLKFCTEHANITAVFCAKFQNGLTTEVNVMVKADFTRFDFKMSFRQIFYNAQPHGGYGVVRQFEVCLMFYICIAMLYAKCWYN